MITSILSILYKRKVKLTKVWFSFVFLTFFLQLNLVEELAENLTEANHPNFSFVYAKCIKASYSKKKNSTLDTLFSLSTGTTQRLKNSFSKNFLSKVSLESIYSSSLKLNKKILFLSQKNLSVFSGLSPPLS